MGSDSQSKIVCSVGQFENRVSIASVCLSCSSIVSRSSAQYSGAGVM